LEERQPIWVASFTDAAGLTCQHGPLRQVEAALALKKAALHGALFNDTYARKETNCKTLGYTFRGGDDSCIPGLMRFFRSKADEEAWEEKEKAAVETYRATNNLDEATVGLLHSCSCTPSSKAGLVHEKECDTLTFPGSWVHRHPTDSRMLVCDQGPFAYAARALAVLKSSPLLPMHQYDQVAPFPCSHFGFGMLYGAVDHCYPDIRMWTRTEQPMHNCPPGGLGPDNPDCDDLGVAESGKIEEELFKKGGFKEFANRKTLSSVLQNHPGCNCRASSMVQLMMRKREGADYCALPENRSPVRDYWTA